MQKFIDTASNLTYSFDPSVKITPPVPPATAYTFHDARGNKMMVPATLVPEASGADAAAYKANALKALAATDNVMKRVAEAVALGLTAWGAADVVTYVHYIRALRAIVSAAAPDTTAPLPAEPPHPAGT